MKESLMCTIGHMKYKLMLRLNEGKFAKWRNRKLKNKDFTIISNNCWGGYVYRLFDLPYKSPTVGLFIMPDDYLKFVRRLRYYLNECELRFISPTKSRHCDELRDHEGFGEYPIGVLDDVEIMFMHYKDEREAYEKWNRRAKRVYWDNLIIKFNDQNGCTDKQIREFNKIDTNGKMICFTTKKIPGKYNVRMWEFKKDGYVVDDKYWLFQHVNLRKFVEK